MVRQAEREASLRFQQAYEVAATKDSADSMAQRGLKRLPVTVLPGPSATWIGVTGAPAYINQPAEEELPSEHSTRAPTASRFAHGMHKQVKETLTCYRDVEHLGEENSAAAWVLPNPLPEWCSGRKADVGRLLEWWECGRDGTPPIREWTSQQLQHCVRSMTANEKKRFSKWKLQFSQDYIMVHTKICDKRSAESIDRAVAIDAVQLEVTSKVAELRKAMRDPGQTGGSEQFFPRAQRLAREQGGATQ